ncbi:MAG: hypothetical protein PHT12_05575 [Patescibacteria group bacterium]|nr:hypothetical protein [Patescibacteria group bacterium]
MNKRRLLLNSLLVTAGLGAFFAYAFLSYSAPARANSPDENANRFFAQLFAEEGKLWTYDPIELSVPGVIHPRSMRIVNNAIVPGGFLGLPVIFGNVARVFGNGVLPYLTPLLGVLGAVAWGLVVARFFGRRVGTAAYLLLLIQPAWWYESGRVFMPNVLFVTLTAWAAYFLLVAPLAADAARRPHKKLYVSMVADGPIAGAFLGLALAVRPAEIYWLALVALVLAAVGWRRLPLWRLMLAGAATAATLTPFLMLNQTVYGSWLATGYAESVSEVSVAAVAQGHGNALLGPLRPYLFPLGFAPRWAGQNFLTYGIGFFGWWSALVAAAVAWLAWRAWPEFKVVRSWTRPAVAFVAVTVVVTVWLTFFYGSWLVRDNPDPNAVSIGSSYLRYWLPFFALWTLPIAAASVGILDRVTARWRATAAVVGFVVLAGVSGAAVFGAPQEGFLALRATLIGYDAQTRQVLALTEPNAVIVADRSDKLLFPERSVITPLRSETTYAALGRLNGHAPLYYLGITFPENDLRWLNEVKLPPLGLRIVPVMDFGAETLYSFLPSTAAAGDQAITEPDSDSGRQAR